MYRHVFINYLLKLLLTVNMPHVVITTRLDQAEIVSRRFEMRSM